MFPLRDLSPTRGTAIVTITLIVINVLAFAAWQPHISADAEVSFLYQRAAVACEITTRAPLTEVALASGACSPTRGAPLFPDKGIALSILTSMFLHGGLLHLLGNMWFLWIFGDNVEEAFGRLGYLLLYVLAGVGATLGFTAVHPASVEPLIGASGAIAGVLGAYLVLFPKGWVLALWVFWIIPVPALIFLGLWFVGQFGMATPGVAWEAHVVGFLIGAIVALAFRGRLLSGISAPTRQSPRAWRTS